MLSLPLNLYKLSGNETETMKEFWDRERNRVIYVRDRFMARGEEEKEYEQAKKADEMNEEQKTEAVYL